MSTIFITETIHKIYFGQLESIKNTSSADYKTLTALMQSATTLYTQFNKIIAISIFSELGTVYLSEASLDHNQYRGNRTAKTVL